MIPHALQEVFELLAPTLTEQENQFFDEFKNGLTNKQIANKYGVGEGSVGNAVRKSIVKLKIVYKLYSQVKTINKSTVYDERSKLKASGSDTSIEK